VSLSSFVKLAIVSEITPGCAKQFEIGDKVIAIFNTGSGIFALDDTCPHRDGSLCEGVFDTQEVTCPWHGAKFSLQDGSVRGPPAEEPVRAYPIRIVEGTIEVLLP
jgi:3-phenylpropionate/trans-cinnamate dioxygenase ferredoxin subunit